MLAGISLLFADLEVNIPFDQNIVGPSYAEQGDYEYVSEWITLTTTGTESYTYHFMYSYENMPANWSMSICNPVSCFMPNFNSPIELGPGEVEQIHIVVNVTSANGFNFNFLISLKCFALLDERVRLFSIAVAAIIASLDRILEDRVYSST